jgi:hypothetical protein
VKCVSRQIAATTTGYSARKTDPDTVSFACGSVAKPGSRPPGFASAIFAEFGRAAQNFEEELPMKSRFWFVTALVLCAVIFASFAPAQDASSRISPSMHMQISSAVERTPEQMDAFDATNAMAGITRQAPFRPTMSAAEYAAMKNVAGAQVAKSVANVPQPPASVAVKFGGATECDGPGGCWIPPDVAGSIGKSQFVSVSNNVFEVRSRSGGLLKVNSLNGLMGYSNQPMFDPRVQYDEEYQRWVITAPAFPESSSVQILGLAVSQTSSATGKFWVYLFNITGIGGTGSFYDYPMLGFSQDALLLTANIFGATAFEGSSLFSIAKARVYNGFGFSVPVFTGLAATLEPAHQLLTDQNPYAWVAAYTGSSITMYAEGFAANAFSAFLTNAIAVSGVPAASGPPPAQQPGSCAPAGANLDSLDGRFQNAGTQAGDLYYQVHSEGIGIFPAPRYFVISGLLSFAPKVAATNFVFASASSFDFNPSIVADASGRYGINWSYTDTNVNASERFCDNNGNNCVPGGGVTVFTSASCYTGVGTSRWGDYSQVSYDPGAGVTANTNTHLFWIDNETIPSANFWSTEIAKMNY